jgi:murein DD-endopeptidase MepM/ murein hydrolase activator NlpD
MIKSITEFPSDLYKRFDFAPVMNPSKPLKPVALSDAVYPDAVADMDWYVGGYLENRKGMYSSPLYNAQRFIHLGIDIWAPAGEAVFAIADGRVFGARDNANELDYGPTVVVEHTINGVTFYALYGHLSRDSIKDIVAGLPITRGQKLAELGTDSENGGWVPHLHFALGIERPAEVDMPGVCAPEDTEKYRILHPDPRFVLGPIY